MEIYKIFRADEWAAFQAAGVSDGAPIDISDGYIHFSTGEQVRETVVKHFAGADDLVLLALDPDALGEALKWEISRGDALFPHLYRALRLDEVLWHKPLPLSANGHVFPEYVS